MGGGFNKQAQKIQNTKAPAHAYLNLLALAHLPRDADLLEQVPPVPAVHHQPGREVAATEIAVQQVLKPLRKLQVALRMAVVQWCRSFGVPGPWEIGQKRRDQGPALPFDRIKRTTLKSPHQLPHQKHVGPARRCSDHRT